MSGCWPVIKAVAVAVHKPVAAVVHGPVLHVVHRVVRRRVARAAAVPAKPVAPSVACAKAPGVLPAGPGGFVAPVMAKTAAVAAVVGTAAMFRADTDSVRVSDGAPGLGGGAAMPMGDAAPAFSGYVPAMAGQAAITPAAQQVSSHPMAFPVLAIPSAPVFLRAPVQAAHRGSSSQTGGLQGPLTQSGDSSLYGAGGSILTTIVPAQVEPQVVTELPEPSSAAMFAVAAVSAMVLSRLRRA